VNRLLLLAVCAFGLAAIAQPQSPRSSPTTPTSPAPGPLEAALSLYSELTGKTVLRSSGIGELKGTVIAELPGDTNAAVRLIESELRKRGIDVVQDGDLFVRVLPVGWTNWPLAGFLATLKPPLPEGETFPRGAILWTAADMHQALAMYREFRSRTLLRSGHLACAPLQLRTIHAMARNQVGYAITVLLALNGIAAIDDGEKFVQLVPVHTWKEVERHAPSPGTNSPLFDPKKIPKSPPGPPTATVKRLDQVYMRLFHSQPPWTPRPVDQLVEIYAELTDQKAAPSKSHGQMPIWFDVGTPVTKEELLYAIETTLKLNNLAIANVEANQISAVPLGAKLRLEKEKVIRSNAP